MWALLDKKIITIQSLVWLWSFVKGGVEAIGRRKSPKPAAGAEKLRAYSVRPNSQLAVSIA